MRGLGERHSRFWEVLQRPQQSVGPLPQTVLPGFQVLLDGFSEAHLCTEVSCQILGLAVALAEMVVGQRGRRRKSSRMTRHDFIIESPGHAVQCAMAQV